jgi:hypothetical protein
MSARRTLAAGEAASHLLAKLSVTGGDRAGRWSVTGCAYDVFDVRYADPGSREHVQDLIGQVGRTFRLVVRTSF